MAVASLTQLTSAVSTPYISGEITSTETFLYGKFIAKVTSPSAKGSTTGFFTQWTGPDWDYTLWNSIEMEIVPSMEPTTLSDDLSYGDGTDRIQEQTYQDVVIGDDAHIYELTWTPNEVSLSIDGRDDLLRKYEAGDPGVDNQTKQ